MKINYFIHRWGGGGVGAGITKYFLVYLCTLLSRPVSGYLYVDQFCVVRDVVASDHVLTFL